MRKYAGVTFDWYDDNGATLKEKFPTVDQVPEIIKTAAVKAKEDVANEQFALLAIDGNVLMRKYACHDPGTTAMSVIYFMRHGHKLPEEAQKVAASNLVDACVGHKLLPPAALSKRAMGKTAAGNLVDITGESAPPRPVKLASHHYAVELDGAGYYPIDTWEQVKTAEEYFQMERIRMEPPIRREYAVKLAARADEIGYPLDNDIQDMGSRTFAYKGHVQAAIDMRKVACDPHGGAREWLDELMDKTASLRPEVFSECLRQFDIHEGLDHGWDQVILNPYESTFGISKIAEVVWEQGADRVTKDALQNLAQNHMTGMQELFTYDIAKEFMKDPIGIFNSMPDPQKKLIARLASDMESQGGTEVGTKEGSVRAAKKVYDVSKLMNPIKKPAQSNLMALIAKTKGSYGRKPMQQAAQVR